MSCCKPSRSLQFQGFSRSNIIRLAPRAAQPQTLLRCTSGAALLECALVKSHQLLIKAAQVPGLMERDVPYSADHRVMIAVLSAEQT